jgi:hypothetical protein
MPQIAQTTPYPLANNTITVTLRSAVNLTADGNCVITLTGLINTETPDSLEHDITDVGIPDDGISSSSVFGSTGVWRRASGSLVLSVASGSTMVAGKSYVFSFKLVNPCMAQQAPSVSMLSSGLPSLAAQHVPHDMTTVLALPGAAAGDAAALKIDAPGFKVKTLAQLSALPGAVNTLIISLSVTTQVMHQNRAAVTIQGLFGSRDHNTSTLPVSSPPFVQESNLSSFQPVIQPFLSPAEWYYNSGDVVLLLAQDLIPGHLYVANVPLLNPYTAQDSPLDIRVSYTSTQIPLYWTQHRSTSPTCAAFLLRQQQPADVASGDATHTQAYAPVFLSEFEVCVCACMCVLVYYSGDEAVLKVSAPGFMDIAASQTSVTPGAHNNITISLQTNFDLSHEHGSRLTLTGFHSRYKSTNTGACTSTKVQILTCCCWLISQ